MILSSLIKCGFAKESLHSKAHNADIKLNLTAAVNCQIEMPKGNNNPNKRYNANDLNEGSKVATRTKKATRNILT